MRRTFSNRSVGALVVVFSVIGTLLLRTNPFGTGQIPWLGAAIVSLAANAVLAYVLTSWAAPYLASTGGKQGALNASRRSIAVAERWVAATLLSVGVLAMLAVSFTSRDLIITPTEKLQRNAELVQKTVQSQAPQEFQRLLTAADTWKMSARTYRTCVPSSADEKKSWCVLIEGTDNSLRVVRYGPGPSNAEQFLKWHPDYKPKRRFY